MMKIKINGSIHRESDDNFWPQVIRVVHLRGGVKAINSFEDPKTVKISQLSTDGQTVKMTLSAYRDIALSLYKLGFGQIVGIDYYETERQLSGAIKPLWMANTPIQKTNNGLFESRQFWAKVRQEGYALKDARQVDIGSRISQQIWTLGNSLRNVSLSYQQQIRSAKETLSTKHYRFSDGNTSEIFDSFQHFLFDACTLRDYLSEVVYEYILPNELKEHNQPITSHGALIKLLTRHQRKQRLHSVLLKRIHSDSEDGGWLDLLTDYRNVITHVCPIAQFNQTSMVQSEVVELIGGKQVIIIKSPIPANPKEIRHEREGSAYDFIELERVREKLNQQLSDSENSVDMLDYCCSVSRQLALYSHEIGIAAGLDPNPPAIKLD